MPPFRMWFVCALIGCALQNEDREVLNIPKLNEIKSVFAIWNLCKVRIDEQEQ
jgi:hypothetical protein